MKPIEILGNAGSIARRLERYEERPQQLQMANAVQQAILQKQHLIVEAGTGVGKSFAYLVPAILSLAENQASTDQEKRRIIVSTHTIALQEQLVDKDLPLLNSVIPLEFSFVLAKGRHNYLSRRRLKTANKKALDLFPSAEESEFLDYLNRWSANAREGSRSELKQREWSSVWEEVQSDSNNCLGRECPTFKQCFYYQARNRMANADILIVNHALFFSDLALRAKGISMLPDYHTVILDEAHTVPDVASDQLGMKITSRQFDYALNKLYNERTQKGLMVFHRCHEGQKKVIRCRQIAEDFFSDIANWLARKNTPNQRSQTVRVTQTGIVQNLLSPELQNLSKYLYGMANQLNDKSQQLDLSSAADRLEGLANELEQWRLQRLEEGVYWIEQQVNRYQRVSMELHAAPLDVGPQMRKMLFDRTDTVVLTSATLATGRDSFDFFQNRVGLTQAQRLVVGSPFDYERQSKLILVDNIEPPNGGNQALHEQQSLQAIKKYIDQTQGNAFVLFTNFVFLNRAARELSPWLAERNLRLLQHEAGGNRSRLLQTFKETPGAVLFGADSFWQGVDVPGDALKNVIITRLPFSVPDQPLLQARLDAIEKSGGNKFKDYQIPEAIIKFKQGFGRLIRSQSDSGIVVVLDSRINNKFYGKLFLQSLPKCQVVTESL